MKYIKHETSNEVKLIEKETIIHSINKMPTKKVVLETNSICLYVSEEPKIKAENET